MSKRSKGDPVRADASLDQAKKSSPLFRKLMTSEPGGHGHGGTSVREDHYKGHHIVIETTYKVTVDGKTFSAPLDVSTAGTVQYHGIPNVGFPSAVDLMRFIIEQFPEDFPRSNPAKNPPKGGHGSHRPGPTARAKRN